MSTTIEVILSSVDASADRNCKLKVIGHFASDAKTRVRWLDNRLIDVTYGLADHSRWDRKHEHLNKVRGL